MKNESPKYRFDKFDENWFLVRISNIASQFKTGGTPSTKEPNFWGGTIPWIQSSDIQKDTLFGVIPQKFILSKTDVFITSGGHNSILEAIYYKVPMLITPISSEQRNRRKKICLVLTM